MTGPASNGGFTPPEAVGEAYAEPASTFRSFVRLPPVHVINLNNLDQADVRLYDPRGRIDPVALETMERLLCDATVPGTLKCSKMDPRVIQLMFKAAYHFGRGEVILISGYREPRKHDEGGYHSQGKAIDFKLTGVHLAQLSAYVRTFSRAGVGVYTHPRTQYVHVDTREQSYHWGDSSGPGRRGGEWSLGGGTALVIQDSKYTRQGDWPERTRAPE